MLKNTCPPHNVAKSPLSTDRKPGTDLSCSPTSDFLKRELKQSKLHTLPKKVTLQGHIIKLRTLGDSLSGGKDLVATLGI